MKTRFALLSAQHILPGSKNMFAVGYKVLRRGRKREREVWVHAMDEIGAFQKAKEILYRRAKKGQL